MKRGMMILVVTAALAAVFVSPTVAAPGRLTEVVVTLDAPPLAEAIHFSRVLTAAARTEKVDLAAPTSAAYLRSEETAQRALAARIATTIPSARITWHYEVVADGFAVLLPQSELARLAAVPGVAEVWPSVTYHALDDVSDNLVGADQMWDAPAFDEAGNGIKIGIIDDGVDQAHPFFNPNGYTMPPGFPKGDTAYTTAKVIVARAFSPPTNTWKYAKTPFDPLESDHATHVAGIAAGDYFPDAIAGRAPLAGVAPNAYLGNYKVLTVPTTNFGLNGNAPEIAAGIEAAVRDGMDVINLSLGEAEIEPTRDLVVAAINGAADAGVVPVIAAGNDFDDFGLGSISSPGSASQAITAAAVTKQIQIADFSSAGPSPVSLLMKPDVSAPGVDITSSVPPREGTWASFSGTSMATPHVAGAVALLKQRHPTWTVEDFKSALVSTGKQVPATGTELPPTREGGGLIDIPVANNPLVFTDPADLSFGLIHSGSAAVRSVALTDAGGGAGAWTVSVTTLAGGSTGATVSAGASVTVPGELGITATAPPTARPGDVSGFVVLTLGTDVRRIPFWFRVSDPKLGTEPQITLNRAGVHKGTTAGKPSRVSAYRYPADPHGVPAPTGPEQVFRFRLSKPVANFGAVVIDGSSVEPFVVSSDDEDRLAGEPGLPLAINPYLDSFGSPALVAAAIRPAPGSYDIVFDTPAGRRPGAYTFRFWVNDVTPPAVRLLARVAKRHSNLELAVTDAGSGVDPSSLEATVDGRPVTVTYANGHALVPLVSAGRGTHHLVFTASDYEELKNMENVPQILPNTTVLQAAFTVR